MRKNAIAVFIFCLLLIGLIIYFQSNKSLTATQTSKKTTVINNKTKLIEQAEEHPGLEKANLTEQEKSGECRSALESIETLPLTALLSELASGALKLDKDCLLPSDKPLESLTGFPGVCAKLENGMPSAECKKKLMYLKAYRIHLALPDDNFMSLSTELLIQKFLGLLVSGAQHTGKGLLLLRAAGAEIYKRLPDSESAAVAAFLNYTSSTPQSLDPANRKNYDTLVDEARVKFPDSWQIFELDLVRQNDISEKSANDTVINFYKSNPESDVAIYYMGCTLWHQQNAIKARELFNKALAIKPTNERYKYAVTQSLTTKPPVSVCYYQYNIDPDNF